MQLKVIREDVLEACCVIMDECVIPIWNTDYETNAVSLSFSVNKTYRQCCLFDTQFCIDEALSYNLP